MSHSSAGGGAHPLVLLPVPRSIHFESGTFGLRNAQLIRLLGDAQSLRFGAARFQQSLRQQTGLLWSLIAGAAGPDDDVALTIAIDSQAAWAQGYRLAMRADGISIVGGTAAGAFYALQTLAQIVRQCSGELPCAAVEDWPDFP